MKVEYAEDCNYWKTGKSSPDKIIENVLKLIESFGGDISSSGFGQNQEKAAYMVNFYMEEEFYKMVWPVLKSKSDETFAARRQAATMLYYDVKAKCISAQVLGVRTAFFSWLALDDGTPMFQLSNKELADSSPQILLMDKENREGE